MVASFSSLIFFRGKKKSAHYLVCVHMYTRPQSCVVVSIHFVCDEREKSSVSILECCYRPQKGNEGEHIRNGRRSKEWKKWERKRERKRAMENTGWVASFRSLDIFPLEGSFSLHTPPLEIDIYIYMYAILCFSKNSRTTYKYALLFS